MPRPLANRYSETKNRNPLEAVKPTGSQGPEHQHIPTASDSFDDKPLGSYVLLTEPRSF